jgi:hypothetical protein
MLGYTLNLIDDINPDILFTASFEMLSKITRCAVDLSEVCTTDEGDVYQVGELPFCTVTVSVVTYNDKKQVQVFVMPLSGNLSDSGRVADWVTTLRGEHIRVLGKNLVEGEGDERIQAA